jgi:hypothetical protein
VSSPAPSRTLDDEPMADQLALAVDPQLLVLVHERRGTEVRELEVGPVPEGQARGLAALLLSRTAEPDGPGPWRCAVAGGSRTVRLARPRD